MSDTGTVAPRWVCPAPMRRLLVIAVLLCAALGVGLPTTASPAQAALPAGVTQRIVLTDPLRTSASADMKIHNDVIRMLDQMPAGATYRVLLYSVNWPHYVDRVEAAIKRGVNVYVTANGQYRYTSHPEYQRLKRIVGSRFHVCDAPDPTGGNLRAKGCISARAGSYAHSKVHMFSQTGVLRNVVAVTSTNMTTSQFTAYNDMLVTAGDRGTWDCFSRYFADSTAERRHNSYATTPNGTCSSAGTRWTLGGRADSRGGTSPQASTDTYALHLARMQPATSCRAWMTVRAFEWERRPIADQIVRFERGGCDTRVLYTGMDPEIKAKLVAAGVAIGKIEHVRADGATTREHRKATILSGNFGGVVQHRYITGTHNPELSSLRAADEVIGETTHQPIAADAVQVFLSAWAKRK